MFKKYLRVQPSAIQLLIFLSFWSVLQLLFYATLPVITKSVTHAVWTGSFSEFYNTQIHAYPQLLIWLNAFGAIFTFLAPALIFAYLAGPRPMQYLGFVKPKKGGQLIGVVLLALALTVPASLWILRSRGETLGRPASQRKIAIVLALFLGWLGAHRFYLGQVGWGLGLLILCWIFMPLAVVLGLIDAIRYLFMDEDTFAATQLS